MSTRFLGPLSIYGSSPWGSNFQIVLFLAWHIRYRDYFTILGAPNLHTPTGINKGQVFYEKKNVAVYCPPARENEILAALGSLVG